VQSSKLTQTLSFGLDIHAGSGDDLQHGCLEARRIRNEANRLDRQQWDWNDIKPVVVDNANHVKNTSQLIVDKALGEIETYHDNKDDGWGRPYPYIDRTYPMVMNHGEGYRLFPEDDGTVRFRITTTRGTLPRVRTVRRTASGAGGGPDSHGVAFASGVTSAGEAQGENRAREELNSVASALQD